MNIICIWVLADEYYIWAWNMLDMTLINGDLLRIPSVKQFQVFRELR